MPPVNTIEVIFPLLEKKITCSPSTSVAQACSLVGYPRNLVCGGKGTCQKCLVSVKIDGHMTEVLSCQHPVLPGMEIFISKESVYSQLLQDGSQDVFELKPQLEMISIPYDHLKTKLASYDLDTLRTLTKRKLEIKKLPIQRKSVSILHQKNVSTLNLVTFNNEIIDLIPANESISLYGIAFDIGTTSVVGYLYDLSSNVMVNQSSALNRQISFGADVINRIDFASQSPENLLKIQAAIHATINEIIQTLCDESKIDKQQIYHCVFCGNAVMRHLFLGIDPIYLGISPFTAVSKDPVEVDGHSFNLNMNPQGKIQFLPLLGGFVGADTTAVLASLPKDEKLRLMIDLGTNGEIAVGNDEKILIASTACGPALEGAGIQMGMRATNGAIEKISFDGTTITCQVIGDVAPIGFCGSGIIDAIAFLSREKLIYDRGNFIKGKDLDDHPLKARFKKTPEGQRYFVIVTAKENPNGQEMIISQKDIRQVQLAKAAIFTGCNLLINHYGIKADDLFEIVLAGAFGNYINIENAQFIGLLPQVPGLPIRSIGNAAGTGVQLYLLSQDEAALADNIPLRASHIELATDPDFSKAYIMNTAIGKSTIS